MKWKTIVIFISISLMINEAGASFQMLVGRLYIFSEKCLSKSVALFELGCLVLLLRIRSSLSILVTNSLLYIWLRNIYSHFVVCPALYLLFFFFWLHCAAHGILVFWPRIKTTVALHWKCGTLTLCCLYSINCVLWHINFFVCVWSPVIYFFPLLPVLLVHKQEIIAKSNVVTFLPYGFLLRVWYTFSSLDVWPIWDMV